MTVIVAMEKSMSNCSYVMKCELEKFFEQYTENPTSIKAFNNFLGEYQLEDVQSSMKVLYTIVLGALFLIFLILGIYYKKKIPVE